MIKVKPVYARALTGSQLLELVQEARGVVRGVGSGSRLRQGQRRAARNGSIVAEQVLRHAQKSNRRWWPVPAPSQLGF